MAMGKSGDEQDDLFVTRESLKSAAHPFYAALNRVLREAGFDEYVEGLCAKYYANVGRPSIPPGVYFRCLLVGYFEGIDSERGIAWRMADSISLRDFLGLPLGKNPPDHSTLSRTRRLLDLEEHQHVFAWVLGVLAKVGLIKGKTIGIDSTTLEANAALRTIVRRADGQSYNDFLTELAKASGVETPTRQDLARFDRKRPHKGSNEDWVNPYEPDAEITRMKNGSTDMAHKQEHVVDMDTGAVLGVTLSGGTAGDTKTIEKSIEEADENLEEVRREADEHTAKRLAEKIDNAVADKGYHSNDVLMALEEMEIRGYISEPARGRRNWKNKDDERNAVYRNRRRIRGERGKDLLRRRGELLERPFAHALETGAMRRTYLRRHRNILKRVLVHVAGLNLGLLMRTLFGVGKPRCLQGRADLRALLLHALMLLWTALVELWAHQRRHIDDDRSRLPRRHREPSRPPALPSAPAFGVFTTGC